MQDICKIQLADAFSDRVPPIERGSCATATPTVALSNIGRKRRTWGLPSFCVSVLDDPTKREGRENFRCSATHLGKES
jgi:hypothetical protein